MRPDGDKAEHVSPELLLQMAADDGKSGFACEGGYSSLCLEIVCFSFLCWENLSRVGFVLAEVLEGKLIL